MRMLIQMSSYGLMDQIKNETIRDKLEVAPLEDKMTKTRLR